MWVKIKGYSSYFESNEVDREAFVNDAAEGNVDINVTSDTIVFQENELFKAKFIDSLELTTFPSTKPTSEE